MKKQKIINLISELGAAYGAIFSDDSLDEISSEILKVIKENPPQLTKGQWDNADRQTKYATILHTPKGSIASFDKSEISRVSIQAGIDAIKLITR